jgi:hypothetical protein
VQPRFFREGEEEEEEEEEDEEDEEDEEVMCNSHFQLTSLPSFKLLSSMQM